MTKRIDNLRKRAHEAEAEVQRLKSELRAANAEVHKLNVEILHAKENERSAISNACKRVGELMEPALRLKREDGTIKLAPITYKSKRTGKEVELSDEETACLYNGFITGAALQNAIMEIPSHEVMKMSDHTLLAFIANALSDAVFDYVKQFIEPETETEPEPESEDVEYDGD